MLDEDFDEDDLLLEVEAFDEELLVLFDFTDEDFLEDEDGLLVVTEDFSVELLLDCFFTELDFGADLEVLDELEPLFFW